MTSPSAGRTSRNSDQQRRDAACSSHTEQATVERYVARWARGQLELEGQRPPSDAYAALHAALVALKFSGG